MNSFMTFVEDKKWEQIEPVSSWKKPDSVPMGILSSFFKLSHFLKVIKTRIQVSLFKRSQNTDASTLLLSCSRN